jgi:hypothetical protein
MPDAANTSKCLAQSLILLVLLFPCAVRGQKTAQSDNPPIQEDQIQAVIVLARHGVRAPIESETRSGAYNAQPWPSWPVADGVLTPHGAEALKLPGRILPLKLSVAGAGDGLFNEVTAMQGMIAVDDGMASLAKDRETKVAARASRKRAI